VDVLIVDDHPIVHQTLSLAVGAVLPGARQHVAFNLTEALEIADGLPLDSLVLLDLGLPEGSGMDVLKRFRSAFPQMVVVVVSATESSVLVAAALKTGAAGYIPKTSSPNLIVAALKVIVAGGTYIPPQILPDVAEVPTLTGRQIEVLMLITKGASNRDIAQALGIADNTAKQHTHAVFQALNVNTRAQAIIAAARLGIGTA
jgi:DNA-binding NarL/FixJ family response regulator